MKNVWNRKKKIWLHTHIRMCITEWNLLVCLVYFMPLPQHLTNLKPCRDAAETYGKQSWRKPTNEALVFTNWYFSTNYDHVWGQQSRYWWNDFTWNLSLKKKTKKNTYAVDFFVFEKENVEISFQFCSSVTPWQSKHRPVQASVMELWLSVTW